MVERGENSPSCHGFCRRLKGDDGESESRPRRDDGASKHRDEHGGAAAADEVLQQRRWQRCVERASTTAVMATGTNRRGGAGDGNIASASDLRQRASGGDTKTATLQTL